MLIQNTYETVIVLINLLTEDYKVFSRIVHTQWVETVDAVLPRR